MEVVGLESQANCCVNHFSLLAPGSSAVVRYDHAESQDDQLWPT